MSADSPDAPAAASPRVPLIPFVAWAVGVLAYPLCFLVALLAAPDHAVGTLSALPGIVVGGLARLPMALLAALVWAVATGGGMALLRRAGFEGLGLGERAVFGAGLGMGILSVGTFLAGKLAGGHRWLLTALAVALLAALAATGGRELLRALAAGTRGLRGQRRPLASALVVALGAGIVLFALTRAHVPVVADYDSLEYHFAAPAAWWRAGQIAFIRDVVYTNFPQNAEMLYLLGMTLVGGPALGVVLGLQVGIGFVVLTAAAIAACGRRLGRPAAGRVGAAICLTTPMLPELGTMNSYVVELPLAAFGFLALLAFLLLREAREPRRRWRYAALCGAMAGLAVGCKYPAMVFVLGPVLAFVVVGGIVRLETLWRSLGEAAVVGAVALAAASPWFIRNAVNTGNPTYPLLYHTFGSGNWTAEQDAKFAKAHLAADVGLLDLGRRFWGFALWRAQPGKPWAAPWRPPAAMLLVLFGLLPFALADRRSTRFVFYFAIVFLAAAAVQHFGLQGLRGSQVLRFVVAGGVLVLITSPAFLVHRGRELYLALYLVLWLIAWYTLTHKVDRFLDPATPAVAALAGLGVAELGGERLRRVAAWLVMGGLAYALATSLLIHGRVLEAALAMPRDEFIRAASQGSTYCHEAIETINQELGPDDVVLFVGEARTFYCRRQALASTVFDRGPIERLLDAHADDQPFAHLAQGLNERGVSHIYVNWPEVRRLDATYAYRYGGEQRGGLSKYDLRRVLTLLRARGDIRPVARFRPGPDGQPAHVLYRLQ
ncbi:MAG: glycosyltransferase family 39 protein [Candidatus Brocadiia bacterium]